MKHYYKREAESEFGEGVAYIEIDGDWPSRQVEIYGDTWLRGDESRLERLADQPFAVLELGPEYQIEEAEFERIWREAVERCP